MMIVVILVSFSFRKVDITMSCHYKWPQSRSYFIMKSGGSFLSLTSVIHQKFRNLIFAALISLQYLCMGMSKFVVQKIFQAFMSLPVEFENVSFPGCAIPCWLSVSSLFVVVHFRFHNLLLVVMFYGFQLRALLACNLPFVLFTLLLLIACQVFSVSDKV